MTMLCPPPLPLLYVLWPCPVWQCNHQSLLVCANCNECRYYCPLQQDRSLTLKHKIKVHPENNLLKHHLLTRSNGECPKKFKD